MNLSRRSFLTVSAAALSACGATHRGLSRAAPWVDPADPRVGTFVSSPWGFSTSSYWIEGPTGLILVDAQFLPSAAERSVAVAEEVTGKRVELAIVLHANPDKYNGTGVLRRRGIRVVSARPVVERIPAIDEERRRFFAERYRPDYPESLTLPEVFGDATQQLSAGGATVTAHVLGAGCSNAHVVVEFDGHIFAGDLIANANHAWLKEADVDAWLARITDMRAMRPRYVHPGRGPNGGPELLDAQARYLELAQRLVREASPTMPPDQAAIDRIIARVEAEHPGYGFGVFLQLGIPAEWRRQAAARAQP
jgi:glyoxylase-like metal-dependent hydrolase (beta-lactamase superfamily II)